MGISKWWSESRLQQRIAVLRERTISGHKPHPIVVEESEHHVCKNCSTEYQGNYCPGCGQTCKTDRLNAKHALNHFMDAFVSGDRGFLHTCIDLVLRPGHMMRDYVEGRRVQYVSPVKMLFILSTIYVVGRFIFFPQMQSEHWGVNIDHGVDVGVEGLNSIDIQGLVEFLTQSVDVVYSNRAFTALFVCLVSAVPFWLLFRKKSPSGVVMNVWEFFYISCYISCQQLMWLIVCLPWERISNEVPSESLGLPFLFTLWDIHQYFHLGLRPTVRRCIIAYALSLVLGLVLIICILALAALVWLVWSKL